MVNHLIVAATRCNKPRPQYGYIAPFFRQAKDIAWEYLKHYSEPIPGRRVNESELYIEFPVPYKDDATKSRIWLYGADNPDRIRGLYFDGVVLDEPGQMKNEVWYEVCRPTLSDRNGWACFIGTPKGINLFYEMFQRAANDPGWFTKLYRVEETGILGEKEIVELRKTMSEAQFRQEMMCDFFSSSDDIYIPLDLAVRAQKRQLENDSWKHAPVVLGVDVARYGADSSVFCLRQGLKIHLIQRHYGLNTMETADKVAGLIHEHKPNATHIDVVGVGAGVVDRLRQIGHQVVEVSAGGQANDENKYVNKRAEMYGVLKEWLELGGQLPDDPQLLSELTSIEYKFDARDRLKLTKKEDMRAKGMASPDSADALAITFAYRAPDKISSRAYYAWLSQNKQAVSYMGV